MTTRLEGMMPEPTNTAEGPAEQRFNALYRDHHREILAYCLRRLPTADGEDAASEVFAVAWRRLDQVPAADEALPWLYGVAHHVVSNQQRAGRRLRRLRGKLGSLGATPEDTPDIQVVRTEEHQRLLHALGELRWPDQEILKLATWERLSHATIAEMLDISEQAVGQRVSRARKRLAAELQRAETTSRAPLPRRKAG